MILDIISFLIIMFVIYFFILGLYMTIISTIQSFKDKLVCDIEIIAPFQIVDGEKVRVTHGFKNISLKRNKIYKFLERGTDNVLCKIDVK